MEGREAGGREDEGGGAIERTGMEGHRVDLRWHVLTEEKEMQRRWRL